MTNITTWNSLLFHLNLPMERKLPLTSDIFVYRKKMYP